jgi:glycosyltransferase involved in cell wall biosynthesis
VRGNAITVRRIERHLAAAGCQVRVWSLEEWSPEEVAREVAAMGPDLVHAFHGYAGGRVAFDLARQRGVPYLLTLTGTDVYEALQDGRREETREALAGARLLAVFHRSMAERLLEQCPELAGRVRIVPQGVELPGDDCQGLGGSLVQEDMFTFILPAGLRAVKDVLFPLEPLAQLYERDPRVRFILAGPVLEPAYAARVMAELERRPFAHYLGGIGHDSIGCLYKKADVVLNTSLFEGGMANSVLEGMAYAKPLLVSAIDGNRSVVTEGETGLLYRDRDGFLAQAGRLLTDGDLRQRLGEAARRYVLENFPPEGEAAAYLGLYGEIVGSGTRDREKQNLELDTDEHGCHG